MTTTKICNNLSYNPRKLSANKYPNKSLFGKLQRMKSVTCVISLPMPFKRSIKLSIRGTTDSPPMDFVMFNQASETIKAMTLNFSQTSKTVMSIPESVTRELVVNRFNSKTVNIWKNFHK